MSKVRKFLTSASLVVGIVALGAQAHAQSGNDIIRGPAGTAVGAPSAPVGATLTSMPLANPQQFSAAEKAAAGAAPAGKMGSAVGFAGGNWPQLSAPNADGTQAYGTSTAPYTTARVAVTVLGNSTSAANTPVTSYPYRPTGKLYFKKPNNASTFVCTASLIKRGVLVTAAHCVHAYGQGAAGWYNSFVWCPANTSSAGGVYGCYTGTAPIIATAQYNGTDTCTQVGVVCNNDIAMLLVLPRSGVYAGNVVGWYGYGWNGWSYRASSFLGNVTTVQLTQLGYPVAFDSGYQMQRTDAVGWYFASGNLRNTQLGSAQTGGSSGGPWVANFGTVPVVSAGASLGTNATMAVVGVTSYGSTTVGFNRQGASFFGQNVQFPAADYAGFGAGNIGRLVQAACQNFPTYC